MPQNPTVIATKCNTGEVHVFDYTKFPLKPSASQTKAEPTLRLTGNTAEGYGLSWSPVAKGHLLSGGEDKVICHWDITAASKEKNVLTPTRTYTGHTAMVEDVDWHQSHDSIFASGSDDRHLML